MGQVIKVDTFEKCFICRKRQARYLCDMPIARVKNNHISYNGKTDYENSFKEYTVTCDKSICEKCSIEINKDIHFCKKCYEKLKA